MGRMKPDCLQLDASLIGVMDSPPSPAHAWMLGIVADIIRTILPDLNEAVIAGDSYPLLQKKGFWRRTHSSAGQGVCCQVGKAN